MTILFTAIMTSCEKDITGEWTVVDMKTDIKSAPQLLIDRAKTLSLATSYEFSSDGNFTLIVTKNEVENIGRKHKGRMIINSKQLTLDTDSLFIENDGIWKLIEQNEFNTSAFELIKMKIEKQTPKQIILSEQEKSGIIYYTLHRKKS